MKSIIVIFTLFVLAFAEMGCSGGVYVTERPAEVVYVHPAAPGAGYVWVEGDWYWSGGRYVWRNGYWAHPRAGHQWVRGSWQRNNRGYYWQKGHWG
jgi:hypothetical protein